MRQERRCVFETNSSSTHSVCIATDRRVELVYPEKLIFHCRDFGWEHSCLSTPEEKAAYLYASILSLQGKKDAENAKNKVFTMLGEVGVDCEFEQAKYFGEGWCENAHVDHAGEDEHLNFVNRVLNNCGRLIRYLFSDHSFVLTGNDNESHDVGIYVDYPHEEYYKGN